MKMFVIVDRYNEGFYWDFGLADFHHMLTEKCLLPIKEMAEEWIEEVLGGDCIAAEITIYQITKDGSWEYSVEEVWADEFKEGEEEIE